MANTADIIIIGGGLYGCATAYNLAKHGAKNVAVLERGDICSGGTAKSCAIVRTHYSIEANLVHAVESLKIFANFDEAVGGDCGWTETGYLIVGPEEHRQPMETVFARQNAHGIDTQILTKAEALERHPLLYLDDIGVIGYDSQSGYADPVLTTTVYAQRARDLGVTIHPGAPATGLRLDSGLKTVETPAGAFEAPVVLLAVGPWTNALTRSIGLEFPYEVSRHKVITLELDRPYRTDWPIIKDLTTPDKIYCRPTAAGTALIGTGDYGYDLGDGPLITEQVDEAHIARMDALISHRVPAFAKREFVAGWSAPYDITPDWNPLVGPVPGYEGLYVATGFSGHGFKLAPTISEGLAQTILGQTPRLAIDMYDMSRFNRGEALHGAYGIGSIS